MVRLYHVYIRTQQGWLYLAVIMDLCSRKMISCAFSDKLNSELTTRALRLAVNKRQPTDGVLFHSDQGVQYTCEAMADIIDYIESFYNQKRRHYKLGNISPAEYEIKKKCLTKSQSLFDHYNFD